MPSDLPAPQRQSVTEEAYAAIRAMLIAGELPPGSRVTVRPIVEKLGLSATPVKAALTILEGEGVLELKLHRGFFVPALGEQDMREIYQMREAIDRLAGRLAATASDHAALADRLRTQCDTQQLLLDTDDVDAYREADLAFHHDLWELSGNGRLQRTGEQLMDQMRLANSLSARLPDRIHQSLLEHRVIVDAIAAGLVDEAGDAAAAHVQSVQRSFFSHRPRD